MTACASSTGWARLARGVIALSVTCSVLASFAPGAHASSTYISYCLGVRPANSWCQDVSRVVWGNEANYLYPNSYAITVCEKINAYGGTKIVETCGTNRSATSIGNCCNYARYALIGNPQQDHGWTMSGYDYYYY